MKRRMATVLVVEDDPVIAKHIKFHIWKTFERTFQVVVANDYQTAKELTEGGHIDIFMIDFLLPDGHGEDLIKLIRKKSFKHPIIAQTVKDDLKYQNKIYREYGRIKYLTKSELYVSMKNAFSWAKTELDDSLRSRILLPGPKRGSFNVKEVCYIERMPNSRSINIELYDVERKIFYYEEMRNLGLEKFLAAYNELGIFMRCHLSYIVNRLMIEEVDTLSNEILLLCRGENEREIRIPIGPTHKKDVLLQLRGLY